jgi:hypothetical protein
MRDFLKDLRDMCDFLAPFPNELPEWRKTFSQAFDLGQKPAQA